MSTRPNNTAAHDYDRGVIAAVNLASIENRFTDMSNVVRYLTNSEPVLSVDTWTLRSALTDPDTLEVEAVIPDCTPDVWYMLKSDYDRITLRCNDSTERGIAAALLQEIRDTIEVYGADVDYSKARYNFGNVVL